MANAIKNKKPGYGQLRISTIMTVYIGSKADEVDAAISSILAQTALPDQFIIFCDGPVAAEVDDVLAQPASILLSKFISRGKTLVGGRREIMR